MVQLSRRFYFNFNTYGAVLQPRQCRNIDGLGCFAFARHYLRNHYCFLFLRVLRCFSSPGSLHFGVQTSSARVAPFGNLRIKGYLHLTAAYRSLSRPSSPLRAKASSIRSYILSSVTFVTKILNQDFSRFTGLPRFLFRKFFWQS